MWVMVPASGMNMQTVEAHQAPQRGSSWDFIPGAVPKIARNSYHGYVRDPKPLAKNDASNTLTKTY